MKQLLSNLIQKLNKDFQPKFFNSCEIQEYLKQNEIGVITLLRKPDTKAIYDTFDSDFKVYLEKLPNSPLKKTVSEIFNRQLVFFGAAKNINGTVYLRVLISKNDKLAGIVLNAYTLDISLKTGACSAIDNVVSAVYYGLLRAAIIIHKQEILRNKELHKEVTSILFLLMLKVLGRNISITEYQKTLLHLICIYLYYRQFLEEKHLKVIKILFKDYLDIFDKSTLEQYSVILDKFAPFNNFKDFPRMVQMFNIADINPAQLTMLIIRFFGSNGFHTLIGSLDNLIPTIILSKYPTDIVGRGFVTNNDVQEKIENILVSYINKISFDDQFNKLVQKSGEN